MTNKELIQELKDILIKESERLSKLADTIKDEHQKQFAKGIAQGVKHSLLKLPICFDEYGMFANTDICIMKLYQKPYNPLYL